MEGATTIATKLNFRYQFVLSNQQFFHKFSK